jgi:hypothetical protein
VKHFFGSALVVAGIAVGLYVGVWWAFIGGIIDVIVEVRAPELDAMNVAVGVAKVMFSGVIGWIAGILFVLPSAMMFKD